MADGLAAKEFVLAFEAFELVSAGRFRFDELTQFGFAGCAGKHRNI